MTEIAVSPRRASTAARTPEGVPWVRWLARATTVFAVAVVALAVANTVGAIEAPLASWRNVALVILLWFIVVDANVYLNGGPKGQQLLFLLPALQITLSLVIFPTLFGIAVSFTQWDIGGVSGPVFNGLDNFRYLANDARFWNALGNN
ncbi:MAG: sugar ABC transporter permease, partial [Thermomicrobiales bacterium]|nr:sugar ABC transporter permease [Thermomicrobiales bacterium]